MLVLKVGKRERRGNEVGAPENWIMHKAVLTPWDKDLKPST
jgi:hypothetical protein